MPLLFNLNLFLDKDFKGFNQLMDINIKEAK